MIQDITKEQAKELAASNWWVGKNSRDVALFQMSVKLLCMPFGAFHEALEKSLRRSVMTHELGLNWDGILSELLAERPAPSMSEVIALIPEAKRIILAV